MTDRELTNEMIKRADEFVEKQKREFAIAELEKIKAEIWNKRSIDLDFDFYTSNRCINLINNHISELKGESNEP